MVVSGGNLCEEYSARMCQLGQESNNVLYNLQMECKLDTLERA